MDRLSLYKELYFKELDRRAALSNDVSLPAGVISVLITVLVFYLTNFQFGLSIPLSLLYGGLLAGMICFLIQAIYHLLRSYEVLEVKSDYALISYPAEMSRFEATLQEYHAQELTGDELRLKVDLDFVQYLTGQLIATTTRNMEINDERSTALYRCKKSILIALAFTLACLIPYLGNFYTKSETTGLQRTAVNNCSTLQQQLLVHLKPFYGYL